MSYCESVVSRQTRTHIVSVANQSCHDIPSGMSHRDRSCHDTDAALVMSCCDRSCHDTDDVVTRHSSKNRTLNRWTNVRFLGAHARGCPHHAFPSLSKIPARVVFDKAF
jgi:hypothetical protein